MAQAASLGLDVEREKLVLTMLATLATSAAVAISGTIGFVGLVVPHLLRLAIGPDHRLLLPASVLYGAALLALADLGARLAGGIPVGIVTALIGAPFFIWLLRRSRSLRPGRRHERTVRAEAAGRARRASRSPTRCRTGAVARCCGASTWRSPRGELVALVGTNGSGKTTLLRLLTGVARRPTPARSRSTAGAIADWRRTRPGAARGGAAPAARPAGRLPGRGAGGDGSRAARPAPLRLERGR